jgi:photosystem I subunit 10
MLHSTLLLAISGPLSQNWSPTVAIVMVAANVLGLLAATTSKVKAGPALAGGFTAAQLLGGVCFGHILGTGAILGLTQIGVI